ncbi:MAG: hypothetical protein E7359_02325 [Clostridiales bacterium]|nr:hypothetical protein [Clostridiales bacterium]
MEKAKKVVVSSIFIVALMAIYNILIFTLYNNLNKNFWAGYAFIMLAMIIMLISFVITNASSRNKNVVGIPLTTLSVYYFILEAILGSLLMFFNIPFLAVLLPQLIVFIIFIAIYVIAVLKFYSLPVNEK